MGARDIPLLSYYCKIYPIPKLEMLQISIKMVFF